MEEENIDITEEEASITLTSNILDSPTFITASPISFRPESPAPVASGIDISEDNPLVVLPTTAASTATPSPVTAITGTLPRAQVQQEEQGRAPIRNPSTSEEHLSSRTQKRRKAEKDGTNIFFKEAVNTLQNINASASKDDSCTAFAGAVASELREMDDVNRKIAKKLINEVLFMGSFKLLKFDSFIGNVETPNP